MTLQEFTDQLTKELAGFTITNVEAEWPFDWNIKEEHKWGINKGLKDYQRAFEPGKYNVLRDDRLGDLLSVKVDDPEYTRWVMSDIALVIVCGLVQYSLDLPTDEQMEALFQLGHFTANEMDLYARDLPDYYTTCFGASALRPLAILVHRVLWDAMCESCGITGWMHGKNTRQYTKGKEFVLQTRLKRFAEYLIEQHLLMVDCYPDKDDSGNRKQLDGMIEIYRDFIMKFALQDCKSKIAFKEFVLFKEREEDEISRNQVLLIQEMRKLNNSERKKSSERKTFMAKAPFAQASPMMPGQANNPFSVQLSADRNAMMMEGSAELLIRLVMEGKYSDLKEVLAYRFKNSPPTSGTSRILKFLDDYINASVEFSNAIEEQFFKFEEENSKLEAAYLEDDYCIDIAEAAFAAILNGDECYKTKACFFAFMRLSAIFGIPRNYHDLPELEDKDDWDDYVYPSDKGSLVMPIVKDGETILSDFACKDPEISFKLAYRLNNVIASYAHCQFRDGLYIRKTIRDAFKKMGYSDRRARDFAIIVATLQYSREMEKDYEALCVRHIYHSSLGSNAAPNRDLDSEEHPISPEMMLLTSQRDEAVKMRKNAERESQKLRHDIAERVRKQEELMEEIASLKEEIQKRDELIEIYEKVTSEEENSAQEEKRAKALEKEFPFHTMLNVVLYGGFHTFHLEIKKLFPDIRIVEVSAHLDQSIFRNADIIFIQINKTGHSGYWTVCDTAKAADVPYYHLNYASARRCAVDMLKWIKEAEGKKEQSHA